jgi:hypothetical protein
VRGRRQKDLGQATPTRAKVRSAWLMTAATWGPSQAACRIGSPVPRPESQLTANSGRAWGFSCSMTAVGAMTMETLALDRRDVRAFAWIALGYVFANDPSEVRAFTRGEFGKAFTQDTSEVLAFMRG